MPICLSSDIAVLLRRRKNVKTAMMRAIMAMGMETPMPAFAPAERLVEGGELDCVTEIEVDVLLAELVVETLADCSVEVVNISSISEANNFNIAVSVLCQTTGMPSQRTV